MINIVKCADQMWNFRAMPIDWIFRTLCVKPKQEVVKSLISQVKPKAFARPDSPPEKDPAFVYKFYSEKRLSSMQRVEVLYYLGINHSKDSVNAGSMGVNKLTLLMKTMTGKAGFEWQLTNHSMQKWMMQKLNNKNVPPTHIMQLPVQRNLQC